jgi:hypothetical protein
LKKFKYEYINDVAGMCKTKCPHSTSEMIGSTACAECTHFLAKNMDTKIVICACTDVMICPNCGSRHYEQDTLKSCLEQCSCDHDWEYEIYSMESSELELERKCSKCSKFEEAYFEIGDITQKALETIWNADANTDG